MMILRDCTAILMATFTFACIASSGCAAEGGGTANPAIHEQSATELEAMVERALGAEDFRATLEMLKGEGATVDLSAGVVMTDGAGIYPDGRALVFPLQAGPYEEVGIAWDGNGSGAVVFTKNAAEPEQNVQASAGTCGTVRNSDNCNYGPWGTSSKSCNNNTTYLYRYEYRLRTWYNEGGRTVSAQYNWYSCQWMSMPADCQSQC